MGARDLLRGKHPPHHAIVGTTLAALMILALAGTAASAADQTALKKEAKVSEARAREIALKEAPGTIKSAELEREKGTLVWSFDIEAKGGKGITEVLVSAIDGHVVETKHETAKAEAAERAKEAKESKGKAKAKPKARTETPR